MVVLNGNTSVLAVPSPPIWSKALKFTYGLTDEGCKESPVPMAPLGKYWASKTFSDGSVILELLFRVLPQRTCTASTAAPVKPSKPTT